MNSPNLLQTLELRPSIYLFIFRNLLDFIFFLSGNPHPYHCVIKSQAMNVYQHYGRIYLFAKIFYYKSLSYSKSMPQRVIIISRKKYPNVLLIKDILTKKLIFVVSQRFKYEKDTNWQRDKNNHSCCYLTILFNSD